MLDNHATLLRRTAQIVGAFLQSERVAPEKLPGIISSVHYTLAGLGQPGAVDGAQPAKRQGPAVPIRRSVQPDRIICLECGRSHKTLKRHLASAHALTPREYRARWGLSPDYPMTAAAYSEQRSAMAKQFGLGTGRGRRERGNARGGATGRRPAQRARAARSSSAAAE